MHQHATSEVGLYYLRGILERTPNFISYVDREIRYRAVSKRYKSYFRRPLGEIIGREMREIIGEVAWKQVEPAMRCAQGGEASTFEAELEVPELGVRFSRGTFTPDFDGDGSVRGVVVCVADISDEMTARIELANKEAFYQSFFNSPEAGRAEIEIASGRFLRVNGAFCAMLGYSEDELLQARTIFDLTHPDDLPRNIQIVTSIMSRQAEHAQVEKRYIKKDGSIIWVSVTGTVLKGIDGATDRIFGTARDITANKTAEAKLRQSERNKDEFMATLAHELRNPLGAMSNILEVWRRGLPENITIDTVMGIIDRQVSQLKHLISDLLDLSRISKGKIRLRKKAFNLALALECAVESSRAVIDSRGHTLHVAHPAQPISIEADLGRLTQVFSNLLTNAAKYTPKRGRIALEVSTEEGPVVEIRVRDTGLGIAEEMLERIFEPFVQVDVAHDMSQSGLGIGLTLIRKLVELHDGTIVANSEGLGKGSEFVVRLPLGRPS